MIYSKLEIFLKSPERKDKYLQALRLLDEAGVIDALRELSNATTIPHHAPDRMQIAAAEHFETKGYQKCLYDLTTLDQLDSENRSKLVADFGATARMLASGDITEEQAHELRSKGHV